MLDRRTQVVIASVIGSFAVHLALSCSSDVAAVSDGAVADARADMALPASSCVKWEVQVFYPSTTTDKVIPRTNADGRPSSYELPTFPAIQIDEGWEPFSASVSIGVLARHCTKTAP